MYGLGDPEIKDFGTSFPVSMHQKPFETDPFGVVMPKKDAEHQCSASNDAQKEKICIVLSALPEKNRKRASVILDCMIRDPHSTAVQIGKEIGLSRATVQRAIDTMKAIGIVSRHGSNNGGQWVIHLQ